MVEAMVIGIMAAAVTAGVAMVIAVMAMGSTRVITALALDLADLPTDGGGVGDWAMACTVGILAGAASLISQCAAISLTTWVTAGTVTADTGMMATATGMVGTVRMGRTPACRRWLADTVIHPRPWSQPHLQLV